MSKTLKIIFVCATVVIVLVLGVKLIGNQSDKHLDNAQADTDRKTGVSQIWAAAQGFYQKTGTYPTVSQVNSPGFQSAYKLSKADVTDPVSKSAAISATPSKTAYSYTPTADD